MNKEEALAFLKKHQPMPEDKELTQELMNKYEEVKTFFEKNPDVDCIPLFIKSFGEDGFGMYEDVRFVFYKLPSETVAGYLKQFLYSKNRNIRHWCAEFALSYSFPELTEPLTYCLKEQDDEIRNCAVIALQFIPEKRVTKVLQEAYEHEVDKAIKNNMEIALKYRKDTFGY